MAQVTHPLRHGRSSLTLLTTIIFTAAALQSGAENWPGWRGPRGDGTSLEKSAPTQWSATGNITWKTGIPGIGHSSPIVWGERVFTATAIPEKLERAIVCLDRQSGKLLWQHTILTSRLEPKHNENSYASGTPATDGERVYVSFLDGKQVVLAACDFNGKQLWLVRLGEFQNDHGYSASPVIYEDKVLLSAQSKQGNFLAAVDRATGRPLWKAQLDNPSNSFGQPLARALAGRPQIILCGDKAVTSFDPHDGARLWFVENPSTDSVITPVYSEKAGLLLTSTSWPTKELNAIKPDGRGNVTQTSVTWKSGPGAPYVPSPIAAGDYFFTISDLRSEIHCFEAATGKILWHEGLGHTHASPVAVNGLIYFLNDEGAMHIVKAAATYQRVAVNTLGEKTFASPAISDGQIFLRGSRNLYCIGTRRQGEPR